MSLGYLEMVYTMPRGHPSRTMQKIHLISPGIAWCYASVNIAETAVITVNAKSVVMQLSKAFSDVIGQRQSKRKMIN